MEAYNETVLRHFEHPVHAGDFEEGYPDVVRAEARASERGFRVVLAAELDGTILRQLRYRVFGCPHLIAATEEAVSRCEGRTAECLEDVSVADLMSQLAVPVEKAGRILLLEDALHALAKAVSGRVLDGAEPAGPGNVPR